MIKDTFVDKINPDDVIYVMARFYTNNEMGIDRYEIETPIKAYKNKQDINIPNGYIRREIRHMGENVVLYLSPKDRDCIIGSYKEYKVYKVPLMK